MSYSPDKWRVIEISLNGETFRKILSSWYGGFAGTDSWRMSSAIAEVVDNGDSFIVKTTSGSEYICNKGWEGESLLAFARFQEFQALVEARGGTVTFVDM